MHVKTCIQYATRSLLASYKVCNFITCLVFNIVCYGYLIFVKIKFSWIS